MRGRAVRLQEDITQQAGVRWVQPVVVFWNEFEAGRVDGENIVFVHGDRLVDWLQEQRGEMSNDWVAHVAACIREARPYLLVLLLGAAGGASVPRQNLRRYS